MLLSDDLITTPLWGTAMQLSDRIGRRMKLQDLHVLMTVVQAGSMGKAAQRLNTVQPAISRSIAELERTIGVRLLDRNPQGVEPTEYGRALLDGGVAVFDDLRQAVKNIEFLADPTAGEVRIGSTAFLATSFVSAVIDRLSRRYPRIVFHLVTALTETLHRELSERNVDLLIVRRFGPIADERLDFEFLFDDSFVVAAGAQSSWVRRRRIELAELVNESWVLPPPESVIGSVAMEAFRASGLDYPRATVVTLTPEVRISLLATGRFVTIFPASVLRFPTRRSELKVLPVELPMARVPNGIVTLKNRTLSPIAQLFIEHAREVAKPLTRRK
jgi:DNA-binding transcriptional LysR family regulator